MLLSETETLMWGWTHQLSHCGLPGYKLLCSFFQFSHLAFLIQNIDSKMKMIHLNVLNRHLSAFMWTMGEIIKETQFLWFKFKDPLIFLCMKVRGATKRGAKWGLGSGIAMTPPLKIGRNIRRVFFHDCHTKQVNQNLLYTVYKKVFTQIIIRTYVCSWMLQCLNDQKSLRLR